MQELQTSAMQNIVSMRCEALNLTGSMVRVPSDSVMDDLKNFYECAYVYTYVHQRTTSSHAGGNDRGQLICKYICIYVRSTMNASN